MSIKRGPHVKKLIKMYTGLKMLKTNDKKTEWGWGGEYIQPKVNDSINLLITLKKQQHRIR